LRLAAGRGKTRAVLERIFQLRAHGTTVSRELLAGVTTFAAMAYILAVNPDILAAAGMPKAALLTATAVSAAIATLLMAALTNLPIALAPGMGINAFFAFSICVAMKVPWQSALGLVFVNGCIFLALSLTGVREKIIEAIPHSLKVAVTAGIGLFIALIGLQNGGLVVANPSTMVSLGDLGTPSVALFFGGLLLTAVLVVRRVPGAILLAILAVSLAGLLVPDGKGGCVTKGPAEFLAAPASLAPTAFQLNFDLFAHDPLRAVMLTLTLLFVDMFDNIGSLIAVTRRAGLVGADDKIPRAGRALVADSTAAILSSLLGTSTVVTYIESATGVQAGGRTGLTAIVTAFCFLAALVFTPVFLAIPAVAVAPALVMVGVFMFEAVTELDARDMVDFAPAVLTILLMPLAFSISSGMGVGLIALVVLAAATGRRERLSPIVLALAAVFLLHFLEGPLLAALK
jgi:AGZA family xanthine/uracil permease-like MFS transporter